MARGWESKSVEAQIDNFAAAAIGREAAEEQSGELKAAQRELDRQRESLVLTRTRVVHDLHASQNPRYIQLLNKSLQHVERQIAALDLEAKQQGKAKQRAQGA